MLVGSVGYRREFVFFLGTVFVEIRIPNASAVGSIVLVCLLGIGLDVDVDVDVDVDIEAATPETPETPETPPPSTPFVFIL